MSAVVLMPLCFFCLQVFLVFARLYAYWRLAAWAPAQWEGIAHITALMSHTVKPQNRLGLQLPPAVTHIRHALAFLNLPLLGGTLISPGWHPSSPSTILWCPSLQIHYLIIWPESKPHLHHLICWKENHMGPLAAECMLLDFLTNDPGSSILNRWTVIRQMVFSQTSLASAHSFS